MKRVRRDQSIQVDVATVKLLYRQARASGVEIGAWVALIARGAEKVISLTSDHAALTAVTQALARSLHQDISPVQKVSKLETEEISRALDQTGGNRAVAAKMLGISERTLYRRLHRMPTNGL